MRRYLIAFLLLTVVVVLAVGFVSYRRLNEPYRGYTSAERFVEIPTGMGPRAIGRRLVEAGVVRDAMTFEVALRVTGASGTLKAGEYRFDRPMTPFEAIDQIVAGRVYLRHLTFPEGLTAMEMARVYESQGFGAAAAFEAATGRAELVRDVDPRARDLEGYLFPETYALPRSATAADLVQMMVERFRNAFNEDMRQRARARGLSIREVVTLASIVEEETGKAEERPLVAAVYANRVKAGMGLQCDPTVIYALQRAGRYTGNLTKEALAFDSPYNTYRYAGLPPGPIASPGKASLEAALNPAEADYLYFVSRNDGSHVFAKTLAEHNRNVFQHQVLYHRQKRLEERRSAITGGRRPPFRGGAVSVRPPSK